MRLNKKLKRRARRVSKKINRTIHVPGVTIRLFDPYSLGPFTIKKIAVLRKRDGAEIEVSQRWLVDRNERPVLHGTRAQLDRQLKKYEFGYLKYIMTKGTAAEGQ